MKLRNFRVCRLWMLDLFESSALLSWNWSGVSTRLEKSCRCLEEHYSALSNLVNIDGSPFSDKSRDHTFLPSGQKPSCCVHCTPWLAYSTFNLAGQASFADIDEHCRKIIVLSLVAHSPFLRGALSAGYPESGRLCRRGGVDLVLNRSRVQRYCRYDARIPYKRENRGSSCDRSNVGEVHLSSSSFLLF